MTPLVLELIWLTFDCFRIILGSRTKIKYFNCWFLVSTIKFLRPNATTWLRWAFKTYNQTTFRTILYEDWRAWNMLFRNLGLILLVSTPPWRTTKSQRRCGWTTQCATCAERSPGIKNESQYDLHYKAVNYIVIISKLLHV